MGVKSRQSYDEKIKHTIGFMYVYKYILITMCIKCIFKNKIVDSTFCQGCDLICGNLNSV